MEDSRVAVDVHELEVAVASYDLVMQMEVEEVYKTILACKEFGARVAGALQAAMTNARTLEQRSRILDAAVLPAFLIGVLVGRGQAGKGGGSREAL